MSDKRPCPFCGGNPVECWSKSPPRQTGFSYIEGEARASIACGYCGIKGKEYVRDCGANNPSDEDVQAALSNAWILWSVRPLTDHTPSPGETEFFEKAYREAGRRASESKTITQAEYYRGVQDGLLAWAAYVKLGINSEILK